MTEMEKKKLLSKMNMLYPIFKKNTKTHCEFKITCGSFIHEFTFYFDKQFDVLGFEHGCSHRKSKLMRSECYEVFYYSARFEKIYQTYCHYYVSSKKARERRTLLSDACVIDFEKMFKAVDMMAISEI